MQDAVPITVRKNLEEFTTSHRHRHTADVALPESIKAHLCSPHETIPAANQVKAWPRALEDFLLRELLLPDAAPGNLHLADCTPAFPIVRETLILLPKLQVNHNHISRGLHLYAPATSMSSTIRSLHGRILVVTRARVRVDNLAPVSVPKYLEALLARGHGCLDRKATNRFIIEIHLFRLPIIPAADYEVATHGLWQSISLHILRTKPLPGDRSEPTFGQKLHLELIARHALFRILPWILALSWSSVDAPSEGGHLAVVMRPLHFGSTLTFYSTRMKDAFSLAVEPNLEPLKSMFS
mmetsp:Transcript_30304/g.65363  ORF Transcript_30304/g.65363 Transcript_30304/m.65363 type:complete len:296 (-) Transcript_30304:749-1636(-)